MANGTADPRAPRGESGFGYDPLFYLPDLEQTAAELDAALKEHPQSPRRGDAPHARPAPGPSARMNERRVIPLVSAQPRAPAPPSSLPHRHRCRCACITRGASEVPYCDFTARGARRGAFPKKPTSRHWSPTWYGRCRRSGGGGINTVFHRRARPACCRPPARPPALTAVRTSLCFAPARRITLEANPGTVEAARFGASREAGVTASRSASRASTTRTSRRSAAFTTPAASVLPVDHALTSFRVGESRPDARCPARAWPTRADLEAAIGFGPAHLSCYHLTLEPNTPFHAAPPALPTTICRRHAGDDRGTARRGRLPALRNLGLRAAGRSAGTTSTTGTSATTSASARVPTASSRPTPALREMRHKHPTAYLAGAARRFRAGSAPGRVGICLLSS